MRSASVIASSWSWVTKMKVRLSSWCSRSHSARSSRRSLASRLDSGSSSRNVDGLVTSVRASATRCDSPPEHWPGILASRWPIRIMSATSRTRLTRSSGAHLLHAQAELDVLRHVFVREQRVALEHHAEIAVARLEIVDHLAVDADFARGRVLEAGDHAQCGGLATAGRPDEDDEFAVLDDEAQVLHRLDGAEGLGEIDQFDTCHAYLRTMPKLKPRARCLRMMRPTIISGMVMPTASAACRP